MIRNLIFDWSGTLADDLGAVLQATNGVCRSLGQADLTLEEFRDRFRLPFTDFYQEVVPGVALEAIQELYLQHFPKDHPVPEVPHARALLEHAAAAGCRMRVLSSAPAEHVLAQARALGLESFFEELHCGVIDKCERLKVLLVEADMKVEETAFIGDMRHDIDAGRAAGVLSVGVYTGYESASRLQLAEPDVLLPDLSRMAAWLLPAAVGGELFPVSTVGALLRDPAGQLLMIRTHKWSDKWGIPGGKIRRGESCEEALRRELMEETGLEPTGIRFVMVQDCVDPPEFQRRAHFLLLNYLAEVGTPSPRVQLNEEAEEYAWVSLDEAKALDLNIPTRVLLEECVRQGMISPA